MRSLSSVYDNNLIDNFKLNQSLEDEIKKIQLNKVVSKESLVKANLISDYFNKQKLILCGYSCDNWDEDFLTVMDSIRPKYEKVAQKKDILKEIILMPGKKYVL